MTDANRPSSWRAADYVVASLLAVVMAAGAWQLSGTLHPVLYQYWAAGLRTTDMWFDADIPRAACLATDRLAVQHQVTALHPLISSALYLPTRAITAVSPAPVIVAMRRFSALSAAVWIVTCYGLLRLMGSAVIDAILFGVLAAVSAAGMFWSAVPEIHILGSITLMLPVCLAAFRAGGRGRGEAWLTLVSAASLSITITNWISGLAAAWIERGGRRAAQISINAFVLVSLLWCVQAVWFPANRYFVGERGPFDAVVPADPAGAGRALTALMSHAVVMPLAAVTTDPGSAPGLSVQQSGLGSSGGWGMMATSLWLLVLGAGGLELWRHHRHEAASRLLVIVIVCQVVLHLVVGDETFLYAMQIAPILIAAAAFAARGRHRSAVRVAVLMLIASAGINNWTQFERSSGLVAAAGGGLVGQGAVLQPADACR